MKFERITIAKHVMARLVGDEYVLLNLQAGSYFGLDPIGSRVWQLLEQQLSIHEILRTLLDEYAVSAESLEQDLESLLSELEQHGLINRSA